jgi:dolichyl-phosphate-mannose-protein mannosyltransferase
MPDPLRGRRRAAAAAAARPTPRLDSTVERAWVAGLLALHLGLALWGAARNSVTFDENFHLPAGVVEVARGRFDVSPVNPPLLKAACGAAALAAGARLPADSAIAAREQSIVGESFMRRNADRYHRVFFAARCMVIALSLLLGFLTWRFARRLHGPRGGVLALALYALAPEALAHAGFVTMDLATGLGFFAAVYAWWGFARSGRWSWWAAAALAVAFTFLVRFTAALLFPILAAVGLALQRAGRARRPRRLWLGGAALLLVAPLALDLGYLGQVDLRPLRERPAVSREFQSLQRALPSLRPPLPTAWLTGLDVQSYESREEDTPTFLLGRVTNQPVRWYFPFALAIKWPLGFWGALLASAILLARRRGLRSGDGWTLLVTPLVFLLSAAFLVNLNVGIRYLFPMLPFLCVASGALAGRRGLRNLPPETARRWLTAGAALAALQGAETAWTAPWYVASFNLLGGGPGGGYRLVNDSNVDWGQGLIDLREILQRRGIGRVHLCYHGSTDPAIYGIDYIPFRGGRLSKESEWLAVSSYFFVGQAQRMMTPEGFTPFMTADFSRLWNLKPAAVAGRSIYLFHLTDVPAGPSP